MLQTGFMVPLNCVTVHALTVWLIAVLNTLQHNTLYPLPEQIEVLCKGLTCLITRKEKTMKRENGKQPDTGLGHIAWQEVTSMMV